jgi:hypothetical protein
VIVPPIGHRAIIIVLAVTLVRTSSDAQGSAGSAGGLEPRFLVDVPTAGMSPKGMLGVDVNFFQEGGLLFGVNLSVIDRLSLGVSYGGSRLIGKGKAVFHPLPGFNVRARPFEEGTVMPAIVVGFDSQGQEEYLEESDRYTILSKGFYLAGSKNFSFAGYFSVHGGLNYSLEPVKDQREIDFFLGVEKTIGPSLSAVAEYSSSDGVLSSDGFMNVGVRWSVGGGFTLGVDIKDITRSGDHVSIGNRAIRIEFVNPL